MSDPVAAVPVPAPRRRLGRRAFGMFVAAWLAAPLSLLAADGQFVSGHARFTVVTPQVIRMEYAPGGTFVDAPSWFAVNRDARFAGATAREENGALTIRTDAMTLTYRDDGKPFSPENLSAEIRRGGGVVKWKPGAKNSGNLGGTITTLDRKAGPVPLGEGVLSRDGWYVLDDSKSHLFEGDWIGTRPTGGNVDWYLFGYGDDYRAALRGMTAIGGAVPMPRKYTLGIWYSRYWSFTTDGFKQIVKEYAEHGFPLDTMVLDMGWHLNAAPPGMHVDTWTGYTWDKALIPDPAALIAWLHGQGLHVTLNDHPAAGVQPHEEMYADFTRAMGGDPAKGETIPFDAGSKRYLDTFWERTHAPRQREGADFWWLDWQQQPKTRSIPDLDNLKVLNWYYYGQSMKGGERGQSFSRWAGWGDHRYPIQFSGDADTGWPMLAFEVPFTATAGNVGAFFWSHDIGGHMGGRNEESYARWCQFGALSAALRSHSSNDAATDRRPWNYPDWAEASMKASFGLRSRLMPYLYTSVRQSTADSVPFTRPVYLDRPGVEAAYHQSQEFQFGDNLLVAPIAMPGVGPGRVASQVVWFPPESDWHDFFTGERFAGGESAIATAGMDEFPLYVRAGVPLPMQPWTARPATAKLEALVLRCYPGKEGVVGTSSVYEDDGVTTGYTRGESATTPLTYVRRGDSVTVTVGPTKGTFNGRPDRRAVVIELPCTQAGATAEGGVCSYDAATFTTRVELPPAALDVARTVTVRVAEASQETILEAATKSKLRQLLGDADESKASTEVAATAAAIRGVALRPVNQHPYGLGDDVAMLFLRNHQTAPEMATLKVGAAAAKQVKVTPGEAVLRSNSADRFAMRVARGVTIDGLPGTVASVGAKVLVPLAPDDNVAPRAKAEASSGDAAAAIDGSTEGYPDDQRREWVTIGEKAGAWLKLTWPQPTRMTHVLLWDRPNGADHIEAGTLEFSDGTRIDVPALPNDGAAPVEITFDAKTCTWVKFTVTQISGHAENAGLAELAVTGR